MGLAVCVPGRTSEASCGGRAPASGTEVEPVTETGSAIAGIGWKSAAIAAATAAEHTTGRKRDRTKRMRFGDPCRNALDISSPSASVDDRRLSFLLVHTASRAPMSIQ
ncbi:hypothetical protein GCM10010109_84610 [Actinoplanes campanulatus]|nr:hypothetical protein GCM10010109_84610 [Actinoplanes campanulatus]GID40428.1 hypothetical protein Aca09nite_69340 [Actinoplanes campanulatus]